jgi:hypothetical protein
MAQAWARQASYVLGSLHLALLCVRHRRVQEIHNGLIVAPNLPQRSVLTLVS